jgi:hypothetical protein
MYLLAIFIFPFLDLSDRAEIVTELLERGPHLTEGLIITLVQAVIAFLVVRAVCLVRQALPGWSPMASMV